MDVVVLDTRGYMFSGTAYSDDVIDGKMLVYVHDIVPSWVEVSSKRVFNMDEPLPIDHPPVVDEIIAADFY